MAAMVRYRSGARNSSPVAGRMAVTVVMAAAFMLQLFLFLLLSVLILSNRRVPFVPSRCRRSHRSQCRCHRLLDSSSSSPLHHIWIAILGIRCASMLQDPFRIRLGLWGGLWVGLIL